MKLFQSNKIFLVVFALAIFSFAAYFFIYPALAAGDDNAIGL
jgi:F0F1-type ATP synthase membrane subunit b/b'